MVDFLLLYKSYITHTMISAWQIPEITVNETIAKKIQKNILPIIISTLFI